MAHANAPKTSRRWIRRRRPQRVHLDVTRASTSAAPLPETSALLAQRIRSGLCFLLVALAPFTSYELTRAAPELEPFYLVKLLQLATILGAFFVLRFRIGRTGCIAVALTVLGTIHATTAVTGVLAHQAIGVVALSIGLAMGTAMLLPWGAGPQSVSVALGLSAVVVTVVSTLGAPGLWEPAIVCVVLAGLSSVCAAHEFEEHRVAHRRLEESSIELRVAEQAGDGLALTQMLERICRLAVEIAPADRAAIYLWSARYGAFVPAAEHGTPAHVAARLTTRPARPDTIQQELRDGKTIVLSRAASLDAEAARALAEADLSALAVIPLPSRGRPLGCLMLGLDTIPTFGEGTLSVARSIATQAATQIEKARLITKLQKAATFRAKLVELAAAINAQADRAAIGGVLCTSGASLFEVTCGAVLLRDGDMLRSVATSRPSAEEPEFALSMMDPSSPLMRALDEARPVFVNDVETTALAEHMLTRALGLKSLLVIPLTGQAGPLGCLVYGDTARRHAFSPAIAEEAVLLAGIGVAALERLNYAEVDEARRYAERHAAGLARYAAELAKTRNAALESARAKSEFLANMSHEIRTPMTAILGYVRLLSERTISDDEHTEYLTTIRRNGEHLLRILNDILDLSKIDAGRMTLERIACSPAELVNEVASLMRARAIEKGLSLEVEYRGAIPQYIEADPTRLRQVLLNLVGNAIKFTEVGRVRIGVELGTGPEGARLQIEVSDTGCGLTGAAQATLFDAFTQGDASTTRTSGGTGLGLAISQRLSHMLGGDITVKSTPNEGSTFTLSIQAGCLDGVPMLDHPTEILRRPATSPATMSLPSRPRVLLVEDALDNQRLLARYLREAGAEVAAAADGITACDMAMGALAAGTPFDVILMDVQMPKLDGYHATARLRGMGYDGAIIALTAHAMESERGRCLDAGCDDFLSKPVEPAELIATIAKHLDERPARHTAPVEAPVSSHLAGEGLDELLGEFVGALPDRVAAMERDLSTSDLDQLAVHSHQLKGTAGAYGFPHLTEAAAELETAVKARRPHPELRAKLQRLGALCMRARGGTHAASPEPRIIHA
jgi:signal transduction histidine kinase/CheY-like chemotaxis protein/HPt (histidine-containing phosphotransfer) domain-containing protein